MIKKIKKIKKTKKTKSPVAIHTTGAFLKIAKPSVEHPKGPGIIFTGPYNQGLGKF